MITDTSTLPVHIRILGPGRAEVQVGEEDIASHVRSITFRADATGDLPTVALELHAYENFEVEGAMHVETYRDPGEMSAAAEVVRSLDAQELQQAALASGEVRMGGGASIVDAVLELVAKALERSG